MLTARSDDEVRVRLLREGAQDFLIKPFLPDELQARVRNLVMAKRAADTLRATLSSMSGDLEALAREISIKNRHLESALAAADVARDQAEHASLVKSSFLGLLSHEIRTPLAAILMNLELLSRGDEMELSGPVRLKLDRLTVAAKQLNTLMEGLLEYTRFEKEGIEPNMTSIDPTVIAREVIDEYALVMQGSPIGLRLLESATSIPNLCSDRRLLKVMLSNLVNNAIKFTRRGEVAVAIEGRDSDCVFAVTDTGEGIPEAALARIFLPFEQLEPLQRKSVRGVGLGLALVRQIAQSLHGRIEVESKVGVGSTFRVVLPFDPDQHVTEEGR
jgi:signal transduction histidine kinase